MIKDIYLLVGGEATRLRPLSEGIPKALLTIKGKLLIDLILKNLDKSNLENINFSSRSIPVGTETDIDVATLGFSTPIYISPPAKVKKLGVITNVIMSILIVQ